MKLILTILLFCSTGHTNETYKQNCMGCHGANGEGKFGYAPKLAGQHWPYLRDQIRDIKLGRRDNRMSPIMQNLFKALTDKEAEDIARYLENINKK